MAEGLIPGDSQFFTSPLPHTTGFLSAFCSRGAKMRLYGLLGGGGKHIFVCKAWGKLEGSGGMLPQGNFDFGPFIRRNLVESGTAFTQTIYHLLCA